MSVKTIFTDIRKNHDETKKILDDINLKYENVISSLGLLSSSPTTIDDVIKNVPPNKKDINKITLDKKKVSFSNMKTNDSSEISKNIMTHIFNMYNDDKDINMIEKYLKSNEKDGMKSLIHCISNLFKLMRIFNQDFFMRLLTILSEKDVFNEMFDLINKDFGDKEERKTFLIDSFFLKFDDTIYDTIKTIYEGKEKELMQKFKRDTTIYNTYNTSNKNDKIILMNQFLYDFIGLNNEANLKKLLVNTTRGNDIANILTDLIDNILKLKEIYENYVNKINTINQYYKKIVDKHSRIFSYLKYRQDTNNVNPRYSVYYDENKYFYLKYCNIDGRIGFTTDDVSSYDYDLAKKYMNENVLKNEYYTFGPFNGIFSNEQKYNTNAKIAVEFSEKILQKLIDEKQNVCVIPWGQSGTGKTSSVIYFSVYDPKKDSTTKMDGVMVEVCNLSRFTNHFDKIQMNMKNIYLQHGSNDYKVVELSVTYDTTKKDFEPTFIFKDGHWVFEKDNNIWMSESINNAFDNREVEPTPNNENSSRSHVIVCLKLFVKNSAQYVNFIVCDLAGVENKFQIDSLREIKKFDERYKISNKYKSDKKELIKFDNYFRNDNEKSDKFKSMDEYKKYNDSKIKLENIYKKYVESFSSPAKSDGGFSDFNDIEFLEKNSLNCDNTLSDFGDIVNVDFLQSQKPNFLQQLSIDLNLKETDKKNRDELIANIKKYFEYKNTNEYISKLEIKINTILYKLTDIAKKVSELYDIITEYRDGHRIYDIKGWTSKIAFPESNKIIIGKFKDFFDIGLNFSGEISSHIPNKIFVGAKSSRKYNLQDGEKTSFDYYVENNELKNYFDLVIYLKYLKKHDLSVKFSNYDDNDQGKYLIVGQIEKYVKDDIFVKSKQKYNNLKQQYLSTICKLGRVLKIYYNGMLRVNEGMMINKSLKELKDDLKLLVLKSFVNPTTGTLPFIFDKEVFPYCRNLYSDENIYEKFYTMPDKDNTKSGKIIEVIKSFGVDVSKLNFVVFTVINLSDYFPEKRKVTNNPPNPPYININNLIYLRNIQKIFPNIDKLRSEINIILKKTTEYEFYNNLDDMVKIREKYNISEPNEFLDVANILIDLIQPNNSATLIGTLADTDSFQNITLADQFPCAEKNTLYEERKNFASEFNLIQVQKPSLKSDGKKKKSIKFRSKRRG
jgi:hypothetical protein